MDKPQCGPVMKVNSFQKIRESQAIYKDAWKKYLMETDKVKRRFLEKIMDKAQETCTSTGRLGEEWDDFIDTLPGYREWWNGKTEEFRKIAQKMKDKYNLQEN